MTKASLMGLTPAQLITLKQTIARELTDIEFDLFLEACRSYKLDPFRKQIIPSIYNKNDKDKRQMTLITTRDGLRVIASRQGNYRPASEPPVFTYLPADAELTGPNPHRVESCTVTLWRKDGDEWFPVIGQVYWDEYAPRGKAWEYSQWPKMPRVMIQKCAEAAALRAGWPDAFAGLYVQEELANAESDDVSASQMVQEAEQERRTNLIGRGILFDIDGTKLEKIEVGKVFDRVAEFANTHTPEEVLHFRERNELALREYWAAAPGDALSLKALIEPLCDEALKATSE